MPVGSPVWALTALDRKQAGLGPENRKRRICHGRDHGREKGADPGGDSRSGVTGDPGEKPCTVRLGGPTCLAGDVMGDYSFNVPLAPGQRLVFGDMAIYTTCKNNTFNGMPLPDIWLLRQDGSLARLAHFGYQDFRCRLGGRG